MLLKKQHKRCLEKSKAEYSRNVQLYLKKNGLVIVQKLCDGILDTDILGEDKISQLLGEVYPIAPWINEEDIIGQFVCLLKEAGYVISYDEYGKVRLKDVDLYNTIVRNHLKMSGRDIIATLAEACQENHGKITYEQLEKVLGFHYPKAPYVGKTNKNTCMLLFLKSMNMLFNFDDEYVYFP